MEEEIIDIPVRLNNETTEALNKMTKKELIDRVCSLAVEAKTYELRCQTAMEAADEWQAKANTFEEKLRKAEAYVEQGRSMIEAVMERWYHYDA